MIKNSEPHFFRKIFSKIDRGGNFIHNFIYKNNIKITINNYGTTMHVLVKYTI